MYTSFVVLERLSGWLSIAAFVQWNKRFAIKFTCGSKTNTIYHHLQCFPQITFSPSLRAYAYAWARPGMNLKHTTYIYRHSIFAAKTSARSRLCLHRLQPSLCTQSNVSKYMLYIHSDIGMTIHHRTSITLCFECSHIHHYVIASLLANAVLPSDVIRRTCNPSLACVNPVEWCIGMQTVGAWPLDNQTRMCIIFLWVQQRFPLPPDHHQKQLSIRCGSSK